MSAIELTEKNFASEIKQGVVLVDFWAPWCGPCQAMLPIVTELAAKFAGRAKVGKVNIDENPGIAEKHGVRSIPTFKIFQNGAEVYSYVGSRTKEDLAQEIEKFLK